MIFFVVISIKNQRLRRDSGGRRGHHELKERKRTLLEQRQQLWHQPRHLEHTNTNRRQWRKSMFSTRNDQRSFPLRGVPIRRHNAAASTWVIPINGGSTSSSDSRRKLLSNVQWHWRTTTNCSSSWVLAMEFGSKFSFSLKIHHYTVFFFSFSLL